MFFMGFGRKERAKRQQRVMLQAAVQAGREVELPELGRITVARTVNCIGDSCPKPQLLTLKALNALPEGAIVELVSDNPTAVETIPAMMLAAYGTHLATLRYERCWKVYVRKGI